MGRAWWAVAVVVVVVGACAGTITHASAAPAPADLPQSLVEVEEGEENGSALIASLFSADGNDNEGDDGGAVDSAEGEDLEKADGASEDGNGVDSAEGEEQEGGDNDEQRLEEDTDAEGRGDEDAAAQGQAQGPDPDADADADVGGEELPGVEAAAQGGGDGRGGAPEVNAAVSIATEGDILKSMGMFFAPRDGGAEQVGEADLDPRLKASRPSVNRDLVDGALRRERQREGEEGLAELVAHARERRLHTASFGTAAGGFGYGSVLKDVLAQQLPGAFSAQSPLDSPEWADLDTPAQCITESIRVDTLRNPVTSGHTSALPTTHTQALTEATPEAVRALVLHALAQQEFADVPLEGLRSVDGRVDHPVVSVPGGDVGLFLNGLSTFERVAGVNLTDAHVEHMLLSYLTQSHKLEMVMGMDSYALENLCRTIGYCVPRLPLDNPPPYLIPRLRAALVKPENQGSPYMRNVLTFPETELFDTRADLTAAVLRAFWNVLWEVPQHNRPSARQLALARSKLRVVITQGPHLESGLVIVHTAHCDSQVPKLVPEWNGLSVGLHFVDVEAAAQVHLAKWIADYSREVQVHELRTFQPSHLSSLMHARAQHHLMASLALDNGHTPLFAFHVPRGCCRSSRGSVYVQ